MMGVSILNVGQCGFDHSNMSRVLNQALGAKVDSAPTAAAAKRALAGKAYDLILVNRIFDGDGSEGVAFIAHLRLEGNLTPMMLVSNYADAQAAAVNAGALPGFGKSDLHDSTVAERIQAALRNTGPADRKGENSLLRGGSTTPDGVS